MSSDVSDGRRVNTAGKPRPEIKAETAQTTDYENLTPSRSHKLGWCYALADIKPKRAVRQRE